MRREHPMPPLRGLGSCCEWFRGLTPTATSCRRCAAEEVGKAKDWGGVSGVLEDID